MFIDDINFLFGDDMWDKKMNKDRLVPENIGYIRGNMFMDEYIPYKNFREKKLEVKTEEEELLLKLSEAEFAMHDISLYLDLHPNDYEMTEEFKKYARKYNDLIEIYQKTYRPLNVNSIYTKDYEYYKNPWPWDNDGGVKYV